MLRSPSDEQKWKRGKKRTGAQDVEKKRILTKERMLPKLHSGVHVLPENCDSMCMCVCMWREIKKASDVTYRAADRCWRKVREQLLDRWRNNRPLYRRVYKPVASLYITRESLFRDSHVSL